MSKLKTWWCDLFHWGKEKIIINFYSNMSHRYYCSKCKYEYDE